jgi:hypothetical protein
MNESAISSRLVIDDDDEEHNLIGAAVAVDAREKPGIVKIFKNSKF